MQIFTSACLNIPTQYVGAKEMFGRYAHSLSKEMVLPFLALVHAWTFHFRLFRL